MGDEKASQCASGGCDCYGVSGQVLSSAPALALNGNWNGNVNVNKNDPKNSNDNLGARRVPRVYLFCVKYYNSQCMVKDILKAFEENVKQMEADVVYQEAQKGLAETDFL